MYRVFRRVKSILCCTIAASSLMAFVLLSLDPGLFPLSAKKAGIHDNMAHASDNAIRADSAVLKGDPLSWDNSSGTKDTLDGTIAVSPDSLQGDDAAKGKNTENEAAPVGKTTLPSKGASLETENPETRDRNTAPAAPQPGAAAPKPAPSDPSPALPPSYAWGHSKNCHFRTEVIVTNNGAEPSLNVWVLLPMLENSSPYQSTVLESTNLSAVSTTGRVSAFNLGDLQPGESRSLTADYLVTLRSVSLNSSNEITEKARQAYNQYAGSGNCLALSNAFVSRCRELGLTARVVTGFARPQKGDMTAGTLQGCRHSWAEYYVEGLGWVPVDLTFQYFSCLPAASHIVETYADQSVKVQYLGGSLSTIWLNSVY